MSFNVVHEVILLKMWPFKSFKTHNLDLSADCVYHVAPLTCVETPKSSYEANENEVEYS